MKTVCGDETTDSKRQFCVPSAGHRGRLLKLVKHRRTRLHYTCWVTLSIWDKVCMLCLIFFSKGDSILSLERPSSRWVVIFRALSKHDPLWMKLEVAEEHKVAEEQSRAKTPTLFESYGYIRFQWNSNLLPWAKDQSSLQLVHYPILEYCVLLVVLFVIVLSGIDVLSDYFL